MAIELITGHAGASHIDSADFGAFNAGVVGPGIYILDGCECTVTSANSVLVAAGDLLCEGRHTRITGTGETLTLANGMSGYKRNDIVAAHYVKDGAGVESVTLTIVKGTAATGGQVDPAMPATGKVLEGATDAYWPLYRIVIDGLTPQTPEKLAGENPIVSTSGGNALPIANGGTGADNAADGLKNLGVVAHIIAEGNTSLWHWRKWSDGKCEMFGGESPSFSSSGWTNRSTPDYPFMVYGARALVSFWQAGNQASEVGYVNPTQYGINYWANVYGGTAYFSYHVVGFWEV